MKGDCKVCGGTGWTSGADKCPTCHGRGFAPADPKGPKCFGNGFELYRIKHSDGLIGDYVRRDATGDLPFEQEEIKA